MGSLRKFTSALVRRLHRRFRLAKVMLFFELTGKPPHGTLLDVGGGSGMAGEFESVYEAMHSVVVNLSPPRAGVILNGLGKYGTGFVIGDGCSLPFASKSFDWVFSNAVIEHVGAWERQRAFAEEIRRVAARGYFVTTPRKYFPLEPHTLFPLYQFLPVWVQKRIVRWTPGYLYDYVEMNLLSARQLRALFPDAQVRPIGFPIWGNSLVAFYTVSD